MTAKEIIKSVLLGIVLVILSLGIPALGLVSLELKADLERETINTHMNGNELIEWFIYVILICISLVRPAILYWEKTFKRLFKLL